MIMISTFYDWLTYNPSGIKLTEVIPQIITYYLVCLLLVYTFIATFKGFTFRNLLSSFVVTAYFIGTFLWQLCFLDRTMFVSLIPAYPLVILLVIKIAVKYFGIRKKTSE